MAEFSFEIEEKLLVLSENDKGWTKEHQPSMTSVAGVQTTPRWEKV